VIRASLIALPQAAEVKVPTADALTRRIEAGEAFDLLVLTNAGIGRPATLGRVTDPAPLARVGVAVKAGAPLPDIATPDHSGAGRGATSAGDGGGGAVTPTPPPRSASPPSARTAATATAPRARARM
jgi:hypothetical protein